MIPVILMMAITTDGFIAKHQTHLANWTSKEDKQLFVEVSKKHGVILMGENTFNTFKRPLPGRLNVVFSRQDNPPVIENVKWVQGEPEKVLEELASMGYKSALLGGGAQLNSLFLEKKLITEMIVTVEPKLFGQGLSLFANEADINLKLINLKKINDDAFMMHYQVIY